jgi:hypothetical protein
VNEVNRIFRDNLDGCGSPSKRGSPHPTGTYRSFAYHVCPLPASGDPTKSCETQLCTRLPEKRNLFCLGGVHDHVTHGFLNLITIIGFWQYCHETMTSEIGHDRIVAIPAGSDGPHLGIKGQQS